MSIRMLAFNTTTELCSVALMMNNNIYDRKVIAPRSHAEKILPMINQLLIDAGVTLQSIDCIIFDRGPGSFVGVRIGISVAQGLALGADLPLVEVSSLAVLAQGAWRIFSIKQVVSTIDARMGELYYARYYKESNDNFWVCSDNESLITAEIVANKLMYYDTKTQRSCALVGTGWNNYSVLMHIKISKYILLKKNIMFPEAQDMIPLGTYNWKNKLLLTPNKIKPIYLRNEIVKRNMTCI